MAAEGRTPVTRFMEWEARSLLPRFSEWLDRRPADLKREQGTDAKQIARRMILQMMGEGQWTPSTTSSGRSPSSKS